MPRKTPKLESEEQANRLSIAMCSCCGELQMTMHLTEGRRVTAAMGHFHVIDLLMKMTRLCALYAEDNLGPEDRALPLACHCEGRDRPN